MKPHRQLLTRICLAVIFAGLLVNLRSIIYHDTGLLLAILALVAMLSGFSGLIYCIISRDSDIQSQTTAGRSDKTNLSARGSDLISEYGFPGPDGDLAGLQYFLHLIQPESCLADKVGLALKQLPEIFAGATFLYFSIEDCKLHFIAGSRKDSQQRCVKIPVGTSIVDEIAEKIKGCIDLRSVKRSANFSSRLQLSPGNSNSGLLLPVTFFNNLHGIIAAISTDNELLSEETGSFLEKFCSGLALMLENHELFFANAAAKQSEAENQLAATLLKAMLPEQAPAIRGWDLAQITRYSLEHSGDFHAYLNLPGDKMIIVIGKCSGPGLNSALFLTRFKAMVGCLLEQCPSPADLLNRLSAYMNSESMTDLFATAAAVLIKASDRAITLALAGHPAPLINRSRSGYVELPQLEGGVPLGLFNKGVEPYKNQTIQLLPGDGILLYTEGVTEFPAGGRDRISLEEFRQMLDRLDENSADVMLENLFRQLTPVNSGQKTAEDHTLIYAKSE
ncbi:MAG: PP2C family protein-serine/threonine phosphatase [Candidatus Riflebacteria bacterium]|nr:PP2C family protein-serine/threonine phosphatase [Candidatus Riflebacteria bacterium]